MNSNATHPREIITTCMAIDMARGSSRFLLLARRLQKTVKTQKSVVEATVTMRCGSILQIDAETCCCCRISLFACVSGAAGDGEEQWEE